MVFTSTIALPPTADPTTSTLVERATAALHRDILAGSLAPDAKLRIVELVERYDIGATPIREALSRLCALGYVHAIGNRGFRVRAIGREDLEDIVGTRSIIEVEALRRSMARGGDEWEATIVATLHRLQKFTDRNAAGFWEGQEAFDVVHKGFHTALIAACGLPRLIQMHESLYDQTYRYRQVMFSRFARPRVLDQEHATLARLVLARDTAAACAHLERHLHSTLDYVYPDDRIGADDRLSPDDATDVDVGAAR
jgi:DNA-binding GntR family transcriptional regulator